MVQQVLVGVDMLVYMSHPGHPGYPPASQFVLDFMNKMQFHKCLYNHAIKDTHIFFHHLVIVISLQHNVNNYVINSPEIICQGTEKLCHGEYRRPGRPNTASGSVV